MQAREKDLEEAKSRIAEMEAELKTLKAAAEQQARGRKGAVKSGAKRGTGFRSGTGSGVRK